jgi:hypothetical protein
VARRVHQILGIRLIHHGKIRIEPDGFPVGAQQPVGDGMKGATPDGSERAAPGLTQGSPGPAQHFVRGPAREREKHDPARIDSLRHEPSHPRRKSFGLARAGSGNGKNWSPARGGGAELFGVQIVNPGFGHRASRIRAATRDVQPLREGLKENSRRKTGGSGSTSAEGKLSKRQPESSTF